MPCIDTVQGFSFCPAVYQLLTIVYGCLSAVNAIIPPQRQNRLQGFTGAFPLIFPISAHTIRQIHKPPIRQLRHAGGHTVKHSTSTDTRSHRRAERCTGQRSRPIIIRYIRVQRCAPVIDPCQTVQHIANHASPAMCRYFPRLAAGVLAWVSLALCFFLARRRGTLDGYRRISFRAFAR